MKTLGLVLMISAVATPFFAVQSARAQSMTATDSAGVDASDVATRRNGLAFTLETGFVSFPEFLGADTAVSGVAVGIEFERVRLGPLSFGGTERDGFGYHGSFRSIPGRSASDFSGLSGLNDIDPAFEVGGGLHYAARDYEVFADVRYGAVGHESLVAELGADAYYRPSEALTLAAGPRLLIGSDDYADTYFAVTPTEAVTSGFDAFDPDGGVLSSGLEASATYDFNDDWGVSGTVRYDLLREDAAESPISISDEQLSVGIMLSRKVTFGF